MTQTTLLKKVIKLFSGDLCRVYFSFKNDLGFDSLCSCCDFQQDQGHTWNSTRWAMHQPPPLPRLHTTLSQLCIICIPADATVPIGPLWLHAAKSQYHLIYATETSSEKGIATADFTAFPKKICLSLMNSSQWHLAAFMTYPHLMWLTDAINFSHPCLWEMLIMKTHQQAVMICTAD